MVHAHPGAGDLSRRAFVTAGAAGAALTALAGCTGGGRSSPGDDVQLTHWDWWVAQEPWILDEIARFEDAHDGVRIDRTLNQFDQYENLIALAQRSGSLPDVYMLPYNPAMPDQVNDGWLHPLNEYATQDWVESFPAYSFVEGINVFDGEIYSAPVTAAGPPYQLYLNNQVFRDAGLVDGDGSIRIPQTWDEVAGFASTINERGNGSVYGLGMGAAGGGSMTSWMNTFVIPAGAVAGFNGLDLRTGQYSFSRERAYEDFIEMLVDWFDSELFHPNSLSIDDEANRVAFTEGQFGMTVSGSYAIAPWVTDQGFEDFSATTLIGPTAERQAYFSVNPGGRILGVAATTEHPSEAFDWLAQWSSVDSGRRMTQEYGIDLSVHPENNDPEGVSGPFSVYAALADLVRRAPSPLVRNPQTARVSLAAVTPSIGDLMVGSVTGQVGDLAGALQTLEEDSDAMLDDAIATAAGEGAEVSRDDWAFPDWDVTQDYAYDVPEYPQL